MNNAELTNLMNLLHSIDRKLEIISNYIIRKELQFNIKMNLNDPNTNMPEEIGENEK